MKKFTFADALRIFFPLQKKIFVIDCFSTDATINICKEYKQVHVIQHEWPGNQAEQFNWALNNCPVKTEWILRLDADEYLMPESLQKLKKNYG